VLPPKDVRSDTGRGAFVGLLQPILSGRAEPGSTVVITGPDMQMEVPVESDGVWHAPALNGLAQGQTDLSLQTTAARGKSKTMRVQTVTRAPSLSVSAAGRRITVGLTGKPGVEVEVLANRQVPWAVAKLDGSGAWSGRFDWFVAPGEHSVSARYTDGTGRFGPEKVVRVGLEG